MGLSRISSGTASCFSSMHLLQCAYMYEIMQCVHGYGQRKGTEAASVKSICNCEPEGGSG
jgi:hypothetical protein